MSISHQLRQLFAERGGSAYGGEAVTQLQHALQCAQLAEQSDASQTQIVAALLHDVGHLLHDLPEDAPAQGIDDRHENSGNRYLMNHFSAAVYEPVRLHVEAKRYLCAVDDAYFGQLSKPSIVSLELQGGPMSPEQCAEFESFPYWQQAVELRRWDDAAKEVDFVTPSLDHFLAMVEQLTD